MHRFQKWRDALHIAPDARAVEGVMKDYVRTLSPEVLAVLPADCRSGMDAVPIDIPAVAVCLLQFELRFRGEPESGAMLHDVAHIFALAATRLTLTQREALGVL